MKGDNQIIGWELSNPDPGVFKLDVLDGACGRVITEEPNPCEPLPEQTFRRLTLKRGELHFLGRELRESGVAGGYYAQVSEEEIRFLLFKAPPGRWASAQFVKADEVPACSLRELSEHLDSEDDEAAFAPA